ncbi:cupin domain-containing protein [Chloroflexota bacterium]
MPVIRDKSVDSAAGDNPDILRRIFINQNIGATITTIGELTMAPGSELPLHTHPTEESMIIMDGEATSILGEETDTLKPGDLIFAPADVKHSLANRGTKPMRFIFFHPTVKVSTTRS